MALISSELKERITSGIASSLPRPFPNAMFVSSGMSLLISCKNSFNFGLFGEMKSSSWWTHQRLHIRSPCSRYRGQVREAPKGARNKLNTSFLQPSANGYHGMSKMLCPQDIPSSVSSSSIQCAYSSPMTCRALKMRCCSAFKELGRGWHCPTGFFQLLNGAVKLSQD